MGLSAARQVIEDMKRLPFDNIVNLDGFDTENPGTLPTNDPEREIARRWRYALAGEGVGWTFTADEKNRWPSLVGYGDFLGGSGRIDTASISATITEITVSVSVPGRWRPMQVATRIASF